VAFKNERKCVPELAAQSLLKTPTIAIRDVYCQGSCRHQSGEECVTATELVFPYRGAYVRHLGHDQAVAEANQVLFFNATEGYRVSHPVPGGDASLLIVWGTDDVYFDVKWSRWLADNIRGTRRRVEFRGARIFFSEERWEEFNKELRAHWQPARQKAL
jgi:pimeloyl-ACP methyl ester carboxylesterase